MLVIASYNAGPGAVRIAAAAVRNQRAWVERIPYPETRYFTKKVRQLIGYLERDRRFCEVLAGLAGPNRARSLRAEQP